MDNLPELRDIHLPPGVSIFPPAYGWWVVLFGLSAAIVLFQVVKVLIKRSKKRYAFRLIDEIGVGNAVVAAMQMSEVLRRICVYKYKSAAALYGQEWIDFLNEKSSVKLEGGAAELFLNAPYQKQETGDRRQETEEIKRFCKSWVGENL